MADTGRTAQDRGRFQDREPQDRGRFSVSGQGVLLNEKGGLDFTTILIDQEDCKLLRTAM